MAWDTYGCVSFSQPVVVQLLLVSNGHQRKQTEIGFCRSAWTLNIFTENANKQKRCKGRQTDFLKWHPLHCIVIRPIIGYFFYISSYCSLKITSQIQLATVCHLQKLRFFFKTCTCANFNFEIFKCLEKTLPFTRQTKSVSLGALNRGTTIIVMRFPTCIVDSFEC